MANNLTNYAEGKMVEHLVGKTSWTMPTVYVGLHTSTTDETGAGTEVSGGSYARTAATFGAHSGGTCANSGAVTFPTASGSWGTITDFALWDASTSGNMLAYGTLTASKTVASGDTIAFAIGDLSVQML